MNVLRVVLAVMLAFLPALCRCHLCVHHDHDHGHEHGEHVHGEPVAFHDLAKAGDHHHDHHHSDVSFDHHGHGVLGLLYGSHDDHECKCRPLYATVQSLDEAPRCVLVAVQSPVCEVRIASAGELSASAILKQREKVPRPQMELLRQHCALIV